MASSVNRRAFLGAAGTAVAATAVTTQVGTAAAEPSPSAVLRLVAVCCSPRKNQTTATALGICLEAARAVAPDRLETELIELAGLKINGAVAAGIPLDPGERDDFPALAPKLSDPRVAGIIIGTPVYFGNMTSLCKAMLERWIEFRKNDFALANKIAGVIAVGGNRNGGQELTVRSVQTALMSQQLIVVGDGNPTAHWGGTVWSGIEGGVTQDEYGLATARNLGKRVAELALLLHGR